MLFQVMATLWWVGLCYGFVLLSAAAGDGDLWPPGTGHHYDLLTTVLLNEPGAARGKDVGFQVTASLGVGVVWSSGADERLLRLELDKPQLHIMSRKAPSPEGFVEHASKLEQSNNSPFFLQIIGGKVENVYISNDEDISMMNLKKGIASVFQLQLADSQVTEKDASGKCKVEYKFEDSQTIIKTKTDCVTSKALPSIAHPDKLLGTIVSSQRIAKYIMKKDLSAITKVTSLESHEMIVALRQDAGGSIKTTTELTRTNKPVTVAGVTAADLDSALREIENSLGKVLSKQILILEKENLDCQGPCPNLSKLVKENYDYLKDDNLGTIKSATAFIKLLNIIRNTNREEIIKVLKNKNNGDIKYQLLDVLGAAQTSAAHEAALKVLNFEDEERLNENERYLWALSLGSHPNPQIVKSILKLARETHSSEKLDETLTLTVAALANKLSKLQAFSQHKIIEEVKTYLVDNLSECQSEECKQKFLRGLKNLGHRDTVKVLLQHAITGSSKTSVTAMKALKSLSPEYWSEDVLKTAFRIYYQLDHKYDSSSRTLAVDIILESEPSTDTVKGLLLSLSSSDAAYEVKQYVWQRIWQIAATDVSFYNDVMDIIKREHQLNNYHTWARRGHSTAFTRSFFSNPSGNGSLVTVQEMSNGLLKRGTVDVVVDSYGDKKEIFSLGLFAGGLGSFVSSDDGLESDEPATAGMEVTAAGVQLRPFVFFNGQGELMGHVWSGSGSEKTPAFQVLTLLQDHLQYLPLQSGFVAELTLLGAVSFDLSGQIQLSLWNRNAHSLVEKNAALVIQGRMRVDTAFIKSQIEFNVATETSLDLVSDIDFYNKIALCLQLQQPNSFVKHNIHKVERIPGSKHRLRKSKYKTTPVSGRTFALNRKNSEMCSVIFADN